MPCTLLLPLTWGWKLPWENGCWIPGLWSQLPAGSPLLPTASEALVQGEVGLKSNPVLSGCYKLTRSWSPTPLARPQAGSCWSGQDKDGFPRPWQAPRAQSEGVRRTLDARFSTRATMEFLKSVPAVRGRLVTSVMSCCPSGHMARRVGSALHTQAACPAALEDSSPARPPTCHWELSGVCL